VPGLRSTTPHGDPPSLASVSMPSLRPSPPRSTTPLGSISSFAPAESSSSARHRMSPPRRMPDSIPDTIPEAVEAPPLQREPYLDGHQPDARTSHIRSASVSPEVDGGLRAASSIARHRHSPSVPVGTSYGDHEKENRLPPSQTAGKALNGSAPLQTPVAQHLLRDVDGRRSRTPEHDQRHFARETSMHNIDASRSSTLRAEQMEMPMASGPSITPRPTNNYMQPQPETQEMQLNHPDPYGAAHSVVPVYMTPAQTGPIRQPQATEYGALQANRTAPAVPPQNYYTEMAAATPASTLPPGRKGLIVSFLSGRI
jgi:hypothetical protein